MVRVILLRKNGVFARRFLPPFTTLDPYSYEARYTIALSVRVCNNNGKKVASAAWLKWLGAIYRSHEAADVPLTVRLG